MKNTLQTKKEKKYHKDEREFLLADELHVIKKKFISSTKSKQKLGQE